MASLLEALLGGLKQWEWVGILLERLCVGLLFLVSGRGKLFVESRRDVMRKTIEEAGIPFPAANAIAVSTVELVCGALLVVGLLTPLSCVMLAAVMVVALVTTHVRTIQAASIADWLGEFLYRPEVLYLVILVSLTFSGPGWLSMDHLIASRAVVRP